MSDSIMDALAEADKVSAAPTEPPKSASIKDALAAADATDAAIDKAKAPYAGPPRVSDIPGNAGRAPPTEAAPAPEKPWWQKMVENSPQAVSADVALSLARKVAAPIVGAVASLGTTAMNPKDFNTAKGNADAKATMDYVSNLVAGQPYTAGGEKVMSTLGDVLDTAKIPPVVPEAGIMFQKPPILEARAKPPVSGAKALETRLGGKPAPNVAEQMAQKPTVVPAPETVPGKPAFKIKTPEAAPAEPAAPTPLSTPDAAEMAKTASPEVRQGLEDAAAKGTLHVDAAKRQLEADSLPVPMSLTEAQALQNPSMISDEMNRRGKIAGMVDRLNGQNSDLIKNLNAVREQVAPTLADKSAVESGKTLIGEYKAMDAAKTADISAKYKALADANGGAFPLDGPAFADAALNGKKTRFLPGEITGELNDIKAGKIPMTFESFEDLRTTLAAATRKAERAADGNQVFALSQVRDALESLPMTADTAALKPLADTARAAAKARFDAIKADPAYKAAINDSIDSGEFVDKFVARGKHDDVAQMVNNLQGSAAAKEAMASGVVNHLKAKASIRPDDTGNFATASFRKELANLDQQEKLDLLVGPQAAQTLRTIGNVAHYTTNQPRGGFVNNSNTLVGAIREGAVNVAEHGANHAAGGLPVGTLARMYHSVRGARKESERMLKPAAGADMSDFPK